SLMTVTCVAGSSQLPCLTPNPSSFTLAGGATQVVTVGYQTLGLGTFTEKLIAENQDADQKNKDSLTKKVSVAGASVGTIFSPLPGGQMHTLDSIKMFYSHPSGMNQSSFKLLINGQDSTARATTTPTSLAAQLALLGAQYSVSSYACAVNGRCDTIPATNFTFVGPPTVWQLDDSLPPAPGSNGTYSGTLPGGLPLPADTARGCPMVVDRPEIRLTSPVSYFSQPAHDTIPTGYIFLAQVNWDTSLTISTLN